MPNTVRESSLEEDSTPRRLDPDSRKAQLLVHAMSAFADAGIERAVHADVAARENVSTPTVFKYFPNRDALVDAVLSEIEISFSDLGGFHADNMVLSSRDLAKVLADLISLLCVNKPDMMKVALIWSVAFSQIRERYTEFENGRLAALQAAVLPGKLSLSDARLFFSSMFLFIRMHFDGTSHEARTRYIDRVCEIFDDAVILMMP